MLRSWQVIIALALLSSADADAALIAYSFGGSVTTASDRPYGLDIPLDTLVSGRFIYDTLSTQTHNFAANQAGYEQNIAGGFYVNFGATHVSVDQYVVQVFNRPSGDLVSVTYRTGLSPALSKGINIPAGSRSTGQLSVSFAGGTDAVANTLPPATLSLAKFPTSTGVLADVFGVVDVMFTVNSLGVTPVPEPSTMALGLFGAIGIIAAYHARCYTRSR